MAGDCPTVIEDVIPSDRVALIGLYSSRHAQATLPSPVGHRIIESTVDANLALSRQSPAELVFLKAIVCGSAAGMGLGRLRRDGRFSFEIIVAEDWLRRGVAKSLLAELNRRCRDLGATEALGHIFRDNEASVALVEGAGFTLRGELEGGRMLEFVKALG